MGGVTRLVATVLANEKGEGISSEYGLNWTGAETADVEFDCEQLTDDAHSPRRAESASDPDVDLAPSAVQELRRLGLLEDDGTDPSQLKNKPITSYQRIQRCSSRKLHATRRACGASCAKGAY